MSTAAVKSRAVDVRQIARELGVRYVLEGSVRKLGSRLRIAGQLIDASPVVMSRPPPPPASLGATSPSDGARPLRNVWIGSNSAVRADPRHVWLCPMSRHWQA